MSNVPELKQFDLKDPNNRDIKQLVNHINKVIVLLNEVIQATFKYKEDMKIVQDLKKDVEVIKARNFW